jgi:ABC-type transporter Mla subunit MlaD
MSARGSRNNVIVGLFLILSLALAVAISFWLGGAGERIGRKARYTVEFPAEIGAAGIKRGSPVTIAGQPAGRVLGVEPWTQDASGRTVLVGMRVEVSIDRSITLYDDATATLVVPLVGGLSSINIGSSGGVSPEAVPLAPGATLRGIRGPGLLAQAGIKPEDIDQLVRDLRTGVGNFNEISERAKRMAATLEPKFGPAVDDAAATVANVRAATEDLRVLSERFPGEGGWVDRIDAVLTATKETMGKAPKLLDDASAAIETGRGALGEAKDAIAENRARVSKLLDDADAAVVRVRDEWVPRGTKLLETADAAASSGRTLIDDLNLIVDREAPQVRQTLTNIRLASASARLAVEEIRANPLRLLRGPSKAQQEREPLYAAARTYAEAVGDLRVASESLDSVLARVGNAGGVGTAGGVNPAEIQTLTEALRSAFAEYERAERLMLDVLAEQAGE